MIVDQGSDPLRVVTIGESSVGKTSIIERLDTGLFNKTERSTVGATFLQYSTKVNDKEVEMQIWDTAGQERYRSLGPIYYRNSSAGIFVFDLTSQETFDKLMSWLRTFIDTAGMEALIFFVGNKSDLPEQEVDVSYVKKWCEEQNYFFFTTSAVTGDGIKELFNGIAAELSKKMNNKFDVHTVQPNLTETNAKPKQCC